MARAVLAGFLVGHAVAGAMGPALDPAELIRDRRAFMRALGATLRAAWDKLDAGNPTSLGREARALAVEAPRIADLFPAGSFGEDSRAQPTIADRRDDFRRLSAELREAAEALAGAAERGMIGEVRRRLFAVGAACQACHRAFVAHPR